jgi:hypothetical protein
VSLPLAGATLSQAPGKRKDYADAQQLVPSVSAPCPSWKNRSRLAEIYLCHAWSHHEIEDDNN